MLVSNQIKIQFNITYNHTLIAAENGTDPIEVTDEYGIDWEGPIPLFNENSVEIPPTNQIYLLSN